MFPLQLLDLKVLQRPVECADYTGRIRAALAGPAKLNHQDIVAISGTALPIAGQFRFVASDRTGCPWIALLVLRGVHQTGSGSDLHPKECAHAGRTSKRPAGEPAGLLALNSKAAQWNCSSSVEPVRAVTLDLPP